MEELWQIVGIWNLSHTLQGDINAYAFSWSKFIGQTYLCPVAATAVTPMIICNGPRAYFPVL